MNVMKTFNGVGMVVFALASLEKIYSVYINWSLMIWLGKLTIIGFSIFFGMLSYIFYTQFKALQITEDIPKIDNNKIDNILKGIKK